MDFHKCPKCLKCAKMPKIKERLDIRSAEETLGYPKEFLLKDITQKIRSRAVEVF